MPEEHAQAYDSFRTRLRPVLEHAGQAAIEQTAPATPEWRVHDVLAHLVGVTDDIVHGRLDGIATDPWTAVQVDKRRDATLAEMLDEWDKHGPAFAELLGAAPAEIAGQALYDAATHEHDIRQALGAPGARDSDAVAIGWDWLVDARTRGGGPAIRYVCEAGEVVGGRGDVRARVHAPRFELHRASAGRRSAGEIAQYDWDPTPEPELLLASPIFRLRTEPLHE